MPDFDETDWLDALENTVKVFPTGPPPEIFADVWTHHPERWWAYIAVSQQDPLMWKSLQLLLRTLIQRQPGSLVGPMEHPAEWNDALRRLTDWALEVAAGLRTAPRPCGRDRRTNACRDAGIVVTVNGITRLGEKPATSNIPGRSACHAVAERLHLSYETVRTVWRNKKYLVKRGQERGIIPRG